MKKCLLLAKGFLATVLFTVCALTANATAGAPHTLKAYDFIMAGSEGAGAASGIVNAKDPFAVMEEMIKATRQAADDLKK